MKAPAHYLASQGVLVMSSSAAIALLDPISPFEENEADSCVLTAISQLIFTND
jgi:hypothetical protein